MAMERRHAKGRNEQPGMPQAGGPPQVTCGGAHAQLLAALGRKALPHGHGLAVQGDRRLGTAHRHHCEAQVRRWSRQEVMSSSSKGAGMHDLFQQMGVFMLRAGFVAANGPFVRFPPPVSVKNLMDGPVRVTSSAAVRSSLPTSALARLHAWAQE